ncbi:DUF1844 domain-containing protein [bacterium]|nr:DUF1844 domain-containing protein [bacterium]
MAENFDQEKKNEVLFLQLIMTFETAAWQQMGKLKNPLTNKIEKDLEQARLSIDMLDMIKAKTEGSRTPNETKVLERILSQLKINFVEELEKERKQKAESEKKTEEKGEKKEQKSPNEKSKAQKSKDKKETN